MSQIRKIPSEAAYGMGILTLALGTALMERADFGLSMVVAPAYLLHRKISQFLPFYSFGMSEYVFQAALILLMSLLLRRFRLSDLFAFVTAVIYGMTLDLCMLLAAQLPAASMPERVLCYLAGMLICSVGVASMFHTYLPPEAYEMFVKELTLARGWETGTVKTVYDCCSCLLGILLSFLFFGFGRFEGVKLGTVFCALTNGWIIGQISRWMDARFEFCDAFAFRSFFES